MKPLYLITICQTPLPVLTSLQPHFTLIIIHHCRTTKTLKMRIFIFRTSNFIKRTLQNSPSIHHHHNPNFKLIREMSQSTAIPKKQLRIRDHGYDNYMEVDKKIRKVLKFQSLILSEHSQSIPIPRLETLAFRIGFPRHEASAFILKFPHVFEIFEHPVQRILFCRLTRKAILQIEQERNALAAQVSCAVTRLRKLLMMSNGLRLRFEHVRIAMPHMGYRMVSNTRWFLGILNIFG